MILHLEGVVQVLETHKWLIAIIKEKIEYKSEGEMKSKSLNCFKVDGEFESFKFCSVNPVGIYEFRMKLLLSTIKAELRRKGVLNLNVLLPGGKLTESWTWNDQSNWGALCNKGNFQSPIDISSGSARKVAFMGLAFKFKKAEAPIVRFNGHETEVKANFGSLVHKLEVGQREFMIEKLKFKFPSEHLIDGSESDGEMLMYLKSKDGLVGIASFLFASDTQGEAQWNTFLDELQIDLWNLGSEDGITLKTSPNIDNIVVGKQGDQIKFQARHIFKRSFYWYTGSDSVPPCTEEVYRFVFSQPIYIPSAQLQFLKEKSYLNELEITGNKKIYKPQGKRISYYHEDEGKKCEADVNQLIDEEEEKIEEEKKKKKTKLSLDVAAIKPYWLRASAGETIYGYTGNYEIPPINDMTMKEGARQSLHMKEVPQHQVPEDIRKRLLKKSQEVINAVNKNSKEYDQYLTLEGPSIISTRPQDE